MEQNHEIITLSLDALQFQALAFRLLVKRTDDQIRGAEGEVVAP